ncbi:MAG: SDR family NAD(P)-dependent oxidoreductase, partial [Pseudomonadota bacterium]
MDLTDKVAIVTGGTRDIGRAAVLRLGAEGAKVAINYCHSKEQGEATLAVLEAAGGTGVLIGGDMTNSQDVDALVRETCAAFGDRIDILVNNVGGLVARMPIAEMDQEFFDTVMRLNLTSTFLTTHRALAHMGAGGSIVNLASQAG